MMLNKNAKEMICSRNGDIDFFDIITEIVQRDSFAPYLFIICLDYVRWPSIDLLKKRIHAKESQEPAENFTDTDYRDNLVIRACTISQAESLFHSLQQSSCVLNKMPPAPY